ncbi:hypothetical protein ACFSW4_02015 [Piscibacillus salipiscarius]|uniref:PGF-pre-PGF domain-containing protein n=1 Tax=Piscibacillus salipiscarius TaxID=299480 RepID=A0ABW5Q7D2_9BACI
MSHTFEEIEEDPEEEGPIDLKVPKITFLGFEATPEELKDYGDMFFVLRFNLDAKAEGYKIYAYSEDGEVEYSHRSDYRVSRISFLEKLYNRWDGKLMHFQVSQIIDGVESEKSKVSTFNFGKEVDPEDDTNDNSSDSDQDETKNNSDDSDTTEEDDTNQTDDRTSNNNNSETDEDETNQTPEIVTVKVSKVNDTHIVTDEAFENVGSGDEINIDLKDDEEADSSVSLTKEQIEYLKENGNKISVERVTTRITIPSSIFEGNENDTVVHVNRLENVFDALSDVYDYTISQGDSTISEFSEPVTISFTVDPEKVQNPDNVKVYYYNEEREEWELIGGTYEDGVVTAETNHFSTYAVFEKEDPSDEETTSDSSEEDSPEENEVAASEPDQVSNNSSSSVIWWMVFGLVIVGAAFIVVRKKLRN